MYHINSGGISFCLYCEESLFIKIIKSNFLKIYIPYFSLDYSSNTKDTNNKIYIYKGKRPNIKNIKNGFEIIYNNYTSIEDIITLIEYCNCYFRQSKGIYSVHGSAVCNNKKGLLLWGPISGIGKTSAAINLCKKYGYSLIGDETIYINKNGYLIGGSKDILFNKKSMIKYLDDIDIKNKTLKTEDKKIKLNLMIQPIIMEKGELEVEEWDKIKKIFHLYEELSRRIRGCSRLINNWAVPIKCIDNDEISCQRIICCNNISNNISAYTIKGNIKDVLKKIHYLLINN